METEIILRLSMATLCGAIIGINRRMSGKDAGIKTNAMVALASALVMLMGEYLSIAYGNSDIARLGAQVVSGACVIGTGSVMMAKNGVYGLTTATSIWMSAILGLCCGIGFWEATIVTMFLVVVILELFKALEILIDKYSKVHMFCIETKDVRDLIRLIRKAKESNIFVTIINTQNINENVVSVITAKSKKKSAEEILEFINSFECVNVAEEI